MVVVYKMFNLQNLFAFVTAIVKYKCIVSVINNFENVFRSCLQLENGYSLLLLAWENKLPILLGFGVTIVETEINKLSVVAII